MGWLAPRRRLLRPTHLRQLLQPRLHRLLCGGVQSQNIFQVKPDASADPKYSEQTNGERMKVQPGNNAPMWRQVGQGVTGYSSLPVTQAPEAGNLIQRFVQYPGSRVTTCG